MPIRSLGHNDRQRKDRLAHWLLLAVVAILAFALILATAVLVRDFMHGQAAQTDSTPAYTRPPVTTPDPTTPAPTTPAPTTPAPTTPGSTSPVDTTPIDTTPIDTTPINTTPTNTPPFGTDPVDTPAVTTPVITTPAVTTPVITTPAVTTPAGSTFPVDTNPQGFPNWIDQRLLTNTDARPGIYMPATDVKYIVVHYTANPGSSATANRNYFNNPSANIHGSSSHFIVGLQGEVIQCIPTDEVAYANYPMNFETISIEVCHPDSTGKYNDATYASLIRLIAWLCGEYYFDETNVIRHYDVHRLNGYPHEQCKNCPKYYVEHPDAWEKLLSDVTAAIGR